ncbi:hypothetical protein FPQ18DRAFT_285404 [Pyronema domesticum]|uniref:Similar to BTB/POZ domain-containing protein 3 acc. no. Q10225 n=1 Tax=Pyronema omphalodes (strain CBS 100304) TaxID=1076935 RepID=U4LLW3_PYROM|nr:hypothetical protein FPQ18DRAFT_285404 [Pyronema domesticum]CCX32928.1 Similar to BTB/POZ domain-containing protein 3; acc. no. Q10225 [Pyronema omphalodes CBS 100304]
MSDDNEQYPPQQHEDDIPNTGTANPLKTQLISHLLEERQDVQNRNPFDESEQFQRLCEACRRGDTEAVQFLISFEKVNINAVDRFDYPPLTLASLCGHYDVVKLLLENGAICERDTFQGERCLYNALNPRIRNLLLQYDYSKSSDPLQPWASGLSSLLARAPLDSTDVTILAYSSGSLHSFRLHKFLLSARSSWFRNKLNKARSPEGPGSEKVVKNVRLPNSMDARAFEIVVKYLYLADVKESNDDQVMVNLEHLSRKFEIEELWDEVMVEDRKKRKQKRTEAVGKAQDDMARWWERVLGERIQVPDVNKAKEVRVEQSNAVFADVVLMAEEDPEEEGGNRAAVLYPVHKGLLRSEYFAAMFNGMFREGQRLEEGEPLKIIPMDMTPAVLELVLSFLYSEKVDIPLEHALDCLMAAEELLLDRLKQKCSHVISSAGNNDDLPYSIYDVIRTGWLTRVRRLEEFGAKYIADRLELYLNDPELPELVAESADRIKARQETDTIEVVDDIRYYLGLRFKQRIGEEDPLFEGSLEDEEEEEEEDKDAVDDKDGWFEKQEKLQGELLDRIDELLENLKLDA